MKTLYESTIKITQTNYKQVKLNNSQIITMPDLFINFEDIIGCHCIVETFTYKKSFTNKDLLLNLHKDSSYIQKYYIKNYFLITKNKDNERIKHDIIKYLHKKGFLNQGRNKYSHLYYVPNKYKTESINCLEIPINMYANQIIMNGRDTQWNFKVKITSSL